MKAILLSLLAGVSLAMSVGAKELTRDEASKIGHDNDGVGNGRFWFEHGDPAAPVVHGGHLLIDQGGSILLTVNGEGGQTHCVDALFDDGSQTRLDFFTSSKGNGWVTAHILKPEVKNTGSVPPGDARSREHRALSPAAELAIRDGDLQFLKTLFIRGLQINEALDYESGTTLLHMAVAMNDLEAVKFLLKNGAKPDRRDSYGARPIAPLISHDQRLSDKQRSLCKILEKLQREEIKIDGTPVGLIAEVLPYDIKFQKKPCFVSWNRQDPSAAVLAEIRKSNPNAQPVSRMETLDRVPLGARSAYQDNVTHQFGPLIEVELKPEKEYWSATVRNTRGPIMAGGSWEGKLRKAYGYWFRYADKHRTE